MSCIEIPITSTYGERGEGGRDVFVIDALNYTHTNQVTHLETFPVSVLSSQTSEMQSNRWAGLKYTTPPVITSRTYHPVYYPYYVSLMQHTLKLEQRAMERTLGVNAHVMRTTKFLFSGSLRSNTVNNHLVKQEINSKIWSK